MSPSFWVRLQLVKMPRAWQKTRRESEILMFSSSLNYQIDVIFNAFESPAGRLLVLHQIADVISFMFFARCDARQSERHGEQ